MPTAACNRAKPHLITLAITTFVLLYSVPSFADSTAAVGYQFVRLSSLGESSNLPIGIGVNWATSLGHGFSVLADFGWSRRADRGTVDAFSVDASLRQVTIAGGLRYELSHTPKAQPYVKLSAGITRSSLSADFNGLRGIDNSSTDPIVQPGGGIAARLGGRLALFGQVDYSLMWTHKDSDLFYGERVDGLRVSCGVRLTIIR